MTEAEIIARTRSPATVETLSLDIQELGVEEGDVLLVHCSLSAAGWISGGATAMVHALLKAVGPAGTVAMPAHSSDVTDPANWGAPAVPVEWISVIRETMPAFDWRLTPTRGMGSVAELFRTLPSAMRSGHPSSSMAASGPMASEITARHELTDPLGPTSPLGALYRLGAKILLIGVDFNRCTALHLAEHTVWPDRSTMLEGAPLFVEGRRQWVEFEVPRVMDDDEFLIIGAAAREARLVKAGKIAEAAAVLAPMPPLVDFAIARWQGVAHPS